MSKIAFVGSRTFCDKELVETLTEQYLRDNGCYLCDGNVITGHELISGGAIGVDKWAEAVGRELGVICWILPADWIKYGKRAGYLRNEEIVRMSDKIVAFWDGESKGTKHTIDLTIKAGKPIDIYIRKNQGETNVKQT